MSFGFAPAHGQEVLLHLVGTLENRLDVAIAFEADGCVHRPIDRLEGLVLAGVTEFLQHGIRAAAKELGARKIGSRHAGIVTILFRRQPPPTR